MTCTSSTIRSAKLPLYRSLLYRLSLFNCGPGLAPCLLTNLSTDVTFISQEVDFGDVISAALPACPRDISLQLHWLAIEGVQPAIPQNPSTGISFFKNIFFFHLICTEQPEQRSLQRSASLLRLWKRTPKSSLSSSMSSRVSCNCPSAICITDR